MSFFSSIKEFFFTPKSLDFSRKRWMSLNRMQSVQSDGLMRCPFCGGHAKAIQTEENYYVECMTCGAKTNKNKFNINQDPKDIWNQKCLAELYISYKKCPFCGAKDGFRINEDGLICCTRCKSTGPQFAVSWNDRVRFRFHDVKTCPFCGGEPDIIEELEEGYENPHYRYRVECCNCHASTSRIIDTVGDNYDSKREAIRLWNHDRTFHADFHMIEPCPFCGNTDGFSIVHDVAADRKDAPMITRVIECGYCGCTGPRNDRYADIQWNQRFFIDNSLTQHYNRFV